MTSSLHPWTDLLFCCYDWIVNVPGWGMGMIGFLAEEQRVKVEREVVAIALDQVVRSCARAVTSSSARRATRRCEPARDQA